MSRKTQTRRPRPRSRPAEAECEHARIVTIECAVQHLAGCIESIEQRMAEIEAAARLAATAQVVAIVKAELDRKWDDTTLEALYRVMARLEGAAAE